MKDIPAIVQSHMAKRIALYGQEPEQPLVEELFKRYSELQSTNDKAFLDAFQKLYGFMEPLSVDATQAASQVVCDLCSETERMAFIIGLHAGMRRLVVHATTKNYNNLFTSLILNGVLDAQTLKERLNKGSDATTYVPTNEDLLHGFQESKLINLQTRGI